MRDVELLLDDGRLFRRMRLAVRQPDGARLPQQPGHLKLLAPLAPQPVQRRVHIPMVLRAARARPRQQHRLASRSAQRLPEPDFRVPRLEGLNFSDDDAVFFKPLLVRQRLGQYRAAARSVPDFA
eukprot:2141341-Rhodomonas_salina.2